MVDIKNLSAAELLVQLDKKRHVKLAPAGDPGDVKSIDDRHLLPNRDDKKILEDLIAAGKLELVVGTYGGGEQSLVAQSEIAGLVGAAAPSSHAASHEDGGADEMSVAGLSGLLADSQTPLAHAHPTTPVPAPAPGPQPPVVHGLGYDPIVQVIDSAGALVTAPVVVYTPGVDFTVDTTGVPSPAVIIFR